MNTTGTLLLVNPNSRGGKFLDPKSEWSGRLKELENSLGLGPIEVVYTTESDHGSGWVRNALEKGAQQVIVVGGDGTLSEAIQGFFKNEKLISNSMTLGVMPAGRGDDFFKSLAGRSYFRSQEAWDAGLKLIQTGKTSPVDLGSIRFFGNSMSQPTRYFINITSFGMPGLVVHKVHEKSRTWLGKSSLTYAIHALTSFPAYQPLPVSITVDQKPFYEGPVQAGFIMNGRYNAGGICWDSEARIEDGLFHLLVLEPTSIATQAKNGMHLFKGNWDGAKGVHRAVGKHIEVKLLPGVTKTHPLFEIDGDLHEAADTQGAEFKIIPAVIRVPMSNS